MRHMPLAYCRLYRRLTVQPIACHLSPSLRGLLSFGALALSLSLDRLFRNLEQSLSQLLEPLERREGTGRGGFGHAASLRRGWGQWEGRARACLDSADAQLRDAPVGSLLPVNCRYVRRFPVTPAS